MKIHVQTAKVVSDSAQRSGNTAEKATVIERNLILDDQLPSLFSDMFSGGYTPAIRASYFPTLVLSIPRAVDILHRNFWSSGPACMQTFPLYLVFQNYSRTSSGRCLES